MTDHAPGPDGGRETVCFDRERVEALLAALEAAMSGRTDARLAVGAGEDVLDTIAHAIHTLHVELQRADVRADLAQEEKRAAIARAEARHGAMLRAMPDLMFVLLRDGTYVDYHARDPKLLFAPPGSFVGRTVREILPAALAGRMMDAIERAWASDEPVVLDYELQMGETRFYEARIVRVDDERLLSIVRDVTESTRASELNRVLARRLISRQEVERQRIARDLHDDISQRIALMSIELDEMAADADSEPLRERLRRLYAMVGETAVDVHQMAYELHPSRLRTLGLVASLQSLCRDMSHQRNLHVTFTHGAVPASVDPNIALCLYRIVQEALHNVARHSQARDAQVHLACDTREIALAIADSGVGFDPRRVLDTGLGLVSMRERVAILNGELSIDAAPGGGTRVRVRIPLGTESTSPAPPVGASM